MRARARRDTPDLLIAELLVPRIETFLSGILSEAVQQMPDIAKEGRGDS
jgi:hypothetical protein